MSASATAHTWIASAGELDAFLRDIVPAVDRGEVTSCCLDTEADSLHHFQEKLCLIQLAIGGKFALIDSLAFSEMASLLTLLDRMEVWLHGADYDLTLFRRTYNWVPRTVRDTQIAARLTGHRHFGLASLIEKQFGVVISKASQKADWSQRPLPEKMLAYAIDDVRLLEPLIVLLRKELQEKGRWNWFVQSCEDLREDVLSRQERDPEDVWRVNGSGSLRSKGLAALRAIWFWRDGIARGRDVPPFRVLNNQQMITMATEFEAQDRIPIPPRWRGQWRNGILGAIDEVRGANPDSWPQRVRKHGRRTTDIEREKIERLCRERDKVAETLGIESSLLGSRSVMENIILGSKEENGSHLMPWQREALDAIIAEVKG